MAPGPKEGTVVGVDVGGTLLAVGLGLGGEEGVAVGGGDGVLVQVVVGVLVGVGVAVLVEVRGDVEVCVGVGVCVDVAVGVGVAVLVGVVVGVAVDGATVVGAWAMRVGVGAGVAGPQAATSKDRNITMNAAQGNFLKCLPESINPSL